MNRPFDPEGSPSYPTSSPFFNENENDWYTNQSPSKLSSSSGENFSFYGAQPQSMQFGTESFNNIQTQLPDDDNFDNEPSLLDELGINFEQIWNKTQIVLIPNKQCPEHILTDADLAGPIFFCMLLGSCLLFAGKVHFGYIYGFSLFGCVGMYTLLNLLTKGIDFSSTCSVLGYCLLPVIALAFLSVFLSLKGGVGGVLGLLAIAWATHSAARLFDGKLALTEQYWLIAYPTLLLYSCFVLITVF